MVPEVTGSPRRAGKGTVGAYYYNDDSRFRGCLLRTVWSARDRRQRSSHAEQATAIGKLVVAILCARRERRQRDGSLAGGDPVGDHLPGDQRRADAGAEVPGGEHDLLVAGEGTDQRGVAAPVGA